MLKLGRWNKQSEDTAGRTSSADPWTLPGKSPVSTICQADCGAVWPVWSTAAWHRAEFDSITTFCCRAAVYFVQDPHHRSLKANEWEDWHFSRKTCSECVAHPYRSPLHCCGDVLSRQKKTRKMVWTEAGIRNASLIWSGLVWHYIHIYTLMAEAKVPLPSEIHIHKPMAQPSEQFGVQCLAQGGARDQTTNLRISEQSLCPLSHSCPNSLLIFKIAFFKNINILSLKREECTS